jgi:hypothetical protein
MNKDEWIDAGWLKCPICGHQIHKYSGQYNHMMKHVRAGVVEKCINPIYWKLPYRFRYIGASDDN